MPTLTQPWLAATSWTPYGVTSPSARSVLEVSKQIFLLGVDRNHRIASALVMPHLLGNVPELGVPVRMLLAFARFTRRLQAVAELASKRAERRARAGPLRAALHHWLPENLRQVSRKSALARAIGHPRKPWLALTRRSPAVLEPALLKAKQSRRQLRCHRLSAATAFSRRGAATRSADRQSPLDRNTQQRYSCPWRRALPWLAVGGPTIDQMCRFLSISPNIRFSYNSLGAVKPARGRGAPTAQEKSACTTGIPCA